MKALNITQCHLLKCPTGRYTYCGNVPARLCRRVEASQSAIVGGRAVPHSATGRLVEYRPMVFDTAAEALGFARLQGETVVA